MSLKSIDMQFAVHKNADAAQLQKQLQDKPVADQAVLASGLLQKEMRKRTRSPGTTKTEQGNIDSSPQNKKRANKPSAQQTGVKEQEPSKQAEHPYKGHRLDLTL